MTIFERTQGIWKRLQEPRLIVATGPCVIESEWMCCYLAEALKVICLKNQVSFIFKASYDKANRTSSKSFRGIGKIEALECLAKVMKELEVPVMTDVHNVEEAILLSEVVDILQVPALLCRQTDLIQAAAATGKIVNLKKGQFMAPEEMDHACGKARDAGGTMMLMTERGSCFGYGNLVVDMRSIPIMQRHGFPILFDATHSIQNPASIGHCSGGKREFAPVLARAAIAAGADGLFVETHHKPEEALSDGPCMVPLHDMPELVRTAVALFHCVRP